MRRFIYLLTITGHMRLPSSYERVEKFVVVAGSAGGARKLANAAGMDEVRYGADDFWLNPRLSKCRKIGEVTPGCNMTERIVAQEDDAW